MSSSKNRNNDAFVKAYKIAMKEISDTLSPRIANACQASIEAVHANKGYLDFTGNATASYSWRVFQNGITSSSMPAALQTPIREKLRFGERVHLDNPLEGEPRTRVGRVNLETDTASEAVDKVMSMPPPTSNTPLFARLTIATEYAPFLKSDNRNVFEDLHVVAGAIIRSMLSN